MYVKINEDFTINTGVIFNSLRDNFENLPEEYLKKAVNYLPFVLAEKIMGESIGHPESYNYLVTPASSEEKKMKDGAKFPFSFTIMGSKGNIEVNYSDNAELEKNDTDFDLFFAI